MATGRAGQRDLGGRRSGAAEIVARFGERLRELGVEDGRSGRTAVVALSGGLDSCVLLHLLHFAGPPGQTVVAAHFDHRMRPGADADRAWVEGVCRAWNVPLVTGAAAQPLTSEDAARVARYTFLRSVMATHDAAWLLTAHHADDQAETVLFRVLRGTGLEGLRGIPSSRAPGVVRPLLPFWREELEAYAVEVGLSWREDPTNEHLGYARNALRHELIPRAEKTVAPAARQALVRLAALAEENESAWAALMPGLLAGVGFAPAGPDDASFDRTSFLALDGGVRGRVLRHLVGDWGRSLGKAGTLRAIEFTTSARSGTRVELGGGIELCRELDRMVLRRRGHTAPDEPLHLLDEGPGSGDAVVGGRCVHVEWDAAVGGVDANDTADAVFVVEGPQLPLTVRGREPGDRIRLESGTRKVKKLLLEARIPTVERSRVPLLVDGSGRVLWVLGVARTSEGTGRGGGKTMKIRIG